MGSPKRRSSPAVVYPETDDMGEHELQRLICELLRPMLARFLAERGRVAHAGADQFVYWAKGEPTRRIAPDIYILPKVSQDIVIRSWKTWETGIVPAFVLEVATEGLKKDYDDNPALYADLGVEELVIFDPFARPGTRSRRVRWQVYRRVRARGFVRVFASQGDRVQSKFLGEWLRAVESEDAVRVRVGLGPNGDELYPTEAEAKDAELEAKDAELEAKDAELERLRRLVMAKRRRRPNTSKKRSRRTQ